VSALNEDQEKLAEFEISDNGIGFSVENDKTGERDQNMNQRMKDIGAIPDHFWINHGTMIRLTFRYVKKYNFV